MTTDFMHQLRSKLRELPMKDLEPVAMLANVSRKTLQRVRNEPDYSIRMNTYEAVALAVEKWNAAVDTPATPGDRRRNLRLRAEIDTVLKKIRRNAASAAVKRAAERKAS